MRLGPLVAADLPALAGEDGDGEIGGAKSWSGGA